MSDLGPPGFAIIFTAMAAGAFAVYAAVWHRLGGLHRIREVYANEFLPLYFRNGVAIMPILGLAVMDAALMAVMLTVPDVPRLPVLIMLVALALLGQVSWIVAYRVPAPFLPPWLRAEIDAGIVPVARPTPGDWLLFATFSLLFTGGAILVTAVALPPLLAGP
jgi:hypothetical protein